MGKIIQKKKVFQSENKADVQETIIETKKIDVEETPKNETKIVKEEKTIPSTYNLQKGKNVCTIIGTDLTMWIKEGWTIKK